MLDSLSVLQAQTLVTGSGAGAWIQTANNRPFIGGPSIGINVVIGVTAAVGNPNVLFRIQGSPDGVTPFEDATDPYGPVSYNGERFIRCQNVYPYLRLVWEFNANDPGYGSSNSSSSSYSGEVTSSSSSGGSSSISFFANLTPAKT